MYNAEYDRNFHFKRVQVHDFIYGQLETRQDSVF